MTNTPPVLVALDGLVETEAITLARSLAGLVWGFKINDLLLRSDIQLVSRLKHYGKVFCDAKLHDIPNTVANQVKVLTEAGADMITLHASGGEAMLKAARAVANTTNTLLLGVSILTSLDDTTVQRLYGATTAKVVLRLATESLNSNMDGVVCAAEELPLLDRLDPAHNLKRVVPAIRFSDGIPIPSEDQQRKATAKVAWKDGADWLVVGRAITTAKNPKEICHRLAEIWHQTKQ